MSQESLQFMGSLISTYSQEIKAAFLCFITLMTNFSCRKARKIRQRIKKHFEDNVSPIKANRDEVYRIDACIVEDPMEREIYETYIINEFQAKYNVDKVFYK